MKVSKFPPMKSLCSRWAVNLTGGLLVYYQTEMGGGASSNLHLRVYCKLIHWRFIYVNTGIFYLTLYTLLFYLMLQSTFIIFGVNHCNRKDSMSMCVLTLDCCRPVSNDKLEIL